LIILQIKLTVKRIYQTTTVEVGKSSRIVRAAEEGTTALKTSFKALATSGKQSAGNLKRSLAETVKGKRLFSKPSSGNAIEGLSPSKAKNFINDELLPAFKKSEHTPETAQILKAIENGELSVLSNQKLLSKGEFGSYLPGKNKVNIGVTGNIQQDLVTLAHEGTHWLDAMKNGSIPKGRGMNAFETLMAEGRAFTVETKFAKLNNLTKYENALARGGSVDEFLGKISNAYGLRNKEIFSKGTHLTDKQFDTAAEKMSR
jgi:hypothetical protein